jgi:rhodanese-related sulfurtransferase
MRESHGKRGFSGYILAPFLSLGFFVLLQEKNPGVRSMTTDEVAQLQSRDTAIVFLDVRNVDEWNSCTGHLKNAILIPLQTLHDQINRLHKFRDRLIVVYCRSGNRSGKAAKFLSDSGFSTVNLRGGMREWNAKKYPVLQEMHQ